MTSQKHAKEMAQMQVRTCTATKNWSSNLCNRKGKKKAGKEPYIRIALQLDQTKHYSGKSSL